MGIIHAQKEKNMQFAVVGLRGSCPHLHLNLKSARKCQRNRTVKGLLRPWIVQIVLNKKGVQCTTLLGKRVCFPL